MFCSSSTKSFFVPQPHRFFHPGKLTSRHNGRPVIMQDLIVDYLRQIGDLVEDAIRRYQERAADEQANTWHANDAIEDLMVCHNRINRVRERALAPNKRD